TNLRGSRPRRVVAGHPSDARAPCRARGCAACRADHRGRATHRTFSGEPRTAWKDGAIRPTDRPIAKAKRGRRRPDPLIQATADLRKWFEAEPWRTGSELLARLQAEYPGAYPDKLLRTLQRRLKTWRSEQANALLFGSLGKTQKLSEVARPH